MTAAEAKKEFEKLAKDHGLSAEQTAAVLQAFDNDKFAGAVANGYARHSEYSSALDKVRDLEGTKSQYEKWYNEQALPVLNAANAKLATLAEYEKLHGPLDDASRAGRAAAAAATGLSREDVDKLLKERTDALSGAFVEYERTMANIREEHRDKFGKRLPVEELEQFMREKKINDLTVAYERWAKPQAEALDKTRREEERKKDREEWEKDFRSRNKLASQQHEEPRPVLEELEKIRHSKDYDADTQNDAAKDAFLSTMREDWAAKAS